MRPIIAVALLAIVVASAAEEEARGKVVSVQDGTIKIAVEGGHVHEGAEVQVFIQLPDVDDTAWVCSGKVTRVDGGRVSATVTERSADPRAGDLASVKTSH